MSCNIADRERHHIVSAKPLKIETLGREVKLTPTHVTKLADHENDTTAPGSRAVRVSYDAM